MNLLHSSKYVLVPQSSVLNLVTMDPLPSSDFLPESYRRQHEQHGCHHGQHGELGKQDIKAGAFEEQAAQNLQEIPDRVDERDELDRSRHAGDRET